MIRVLHTGDVHLGDMAGPTKDGVNLRRLDTLACMDHIVQTARDQGPHLTIIAGDLFNRSRVWADTALDDVNDALSRFIRPLCEYSDAVVLLFGTMNHDNPRAFEVIKKATGDLENLHIYTTPKVEKITTSAGPVQIMAVPGFDKARLRLFNPGADKEMENRNATALVNDIVLGLSTEIDHSVPSILTAHYTVSGSESENGSTFLAGQDVVILPATIDATRADLACFGHIHKPQKLMSTVPAYYCGSPNQLTFNDEGDDHGFWIHDIYNPKSEGVSRSEFIHTPERHHFTLRLSADDVVRFISSGEYTAPPGVKENIVRIRYSCTTEQEKAFNRAELQRQIMAAGAFYVAEIVPEDIEDLDAKNQLTEHDGPAECLARWLVANEITGEKADRLMGLAAPIIRGADDGRDDGKHTGAFVPKTILVRNYRSYTDAFFDFEPVHMAMVNGRNGVGKSSLFMDAIADCLYEETRKEDIGGWVRDGTKSGSITFTFDMGGQTYRVVRTRTKAGRGTLALQRFDTEAEDWADESDTTMKLTQAKIERLLGMDCNTFCSIALIRQDAYGLFLDADSDRRMEVLSALLGLDMAMRKAQELGKDTPDVVCWNYGGRATAELNHGRSGGNGALMRAIYPALYYPAEERAVQETIDQGRMTHWDADSDEACKIYAAVVHCIIADAAAGASDATALLLGLHNSLGGTRYDLEDIMEKGRAGELRPTGYVVDSLECALYALWETSGECDEAIIKAANMGGDADTIAAICGGLAGALYGFASIPQEWIAALSEADRARLDAAVEAALSNWLS